MSKTLNFFLKDRTLMYALSIIGGSSFFVQYCSQTFYVEKYASFFRKKRVSSSTTNFFVPVHVNVKNRFNEVIDDLEMSEFNRKLCNLFVTNNLEMVELGTFNSMYGIMLGIPENYSCETKEDLEKLQITIDSKLINWDSREGELLAKVLLLNKNAQKYAIAKHTILLDNYRFLILSLLPSGVCVFFKLTINQIRSKFKKSGIIASLYLTSVAFYLCVWLATHTIIKSLYDKSAEDKVSTLGRLYILGGIEYYNKLQLQNLILRSSMEKGHKYYTANGDYKSLLRLQLPIALKRSYLEDLLHEENLLEESKQFPKPRMSH